MSKSTKKKETSETSEQHEVFDVFTLPVHEIVDLYPALPTGSAERAALKESIRTTGVIIPVVIWRDQKGKPWIIDGRNRTEMCRELNEEGATINGQPIRPMLHEIEGTELDALSVAQKLNRERRHLRPSQRAAITVRAHSLYNKYAKRRKPAPGDPKPAKESDENVGNRLAAEAGVNRVYIFQCGKLHKEAPDLLEQVCNGEMPIPQALKELKKRLAGKPEAGSDGDTEGHEEGASAPPAPVVKDGLKREVKIQHMAIFATRDSFTEAIKLLRKSRAEVEALCDGPGGAFLYKQELLADYGNVIDTLAGGMPHVECPYCSGTGKDDMNTKKKCSHCKGAMYLDKTQWKLCPDEIKEMITGTKGDSLVEEAAAQVDDEISEAVDSALLNGSTEVPEFNEEPEMATTTSEDQLI